MKAARAILAAAVCFAPDFAATAFSQIWTLTSAPHTNWSSIAASTDGARLVAAGGLLRAHHSGDNPDDSAPIWVSTNSGLDWTRTSAPIYPWQSVASSADGTRLVAVSVTRIGSALTNGVIYTSTNGGTDWISNAAPKLFYWSSVASSADGLKLVAAAWGGGIYTSTNGGGKWTARPAPLTNWVSVASSADGARLVAAHAGDVLNTGNIYLSTNSGATWHLSPAPGAYWHSVASSADGSRLAAAPHADGGLIYLSTNSGLTWTASSAPAQYYFALASSADGRTLVAGSGTVSTDFGATWSSNSLAYLFCVAFTSSADGSILAAATDDGLLVARLTLAPWLNLTPANGNLQLSWLVPSTNLVLQTSSSLNGGTWTDVGTQPTLTLTDLHYRLTITPTNSQEFFRLHSR